MSGAFLRCQAFAWFLGKRVETRLMRHGEHDDLKKEMAMSKGPN